jgi:twinkle protein
VGKMSVRGGGAITDLTFNIFSIWRNKAKEREVQDYKDTNVLPPKKSLDEMMSAPDCILTIEKSRNVEDAEGKYGLWYDSRGMIYKGSRDAPPISLYREHKRHTREQDEPNPFDD